MVQTIIPRVAGSYKKISAEKSILINKLADLEHKIEVNHLIDT